MCLMNLSPAALYGRVSTGVVLGHRDTGVCLVSSPSPCTAPALADSFSERDTDEQTSSQHLNNLIKEFSLERSAVSKPDNRESLPVVSDVWLSVLSVELLLPGFAEHFIYTARSEILYHLLDQRYQTANY